MTNEQLSIYLSGLINRLRIAIEKASEMMPEGAARPVTRAHIVSHAKGATMAAMLAGGMDAIRCADPAHFADVPAGQYPALEPLEEFVREIEAEMETLKGGTR